jgi:hypothetical protein
MTAERPETYVIPKENVETIHVRYDNTEYCLYFENRGGVEELLVLSESRAKWLAEDLKDDQDDATEVTRHEIENVYGDTIRVHIPDVAVKRLSNRAKQALEHLGGSDIREKHPRDEDSNAECLSEK